MSPNPLLVVDSLTLSFGGVKVLNGASFEMEAGELTALLGPNGAGKTSLLNCINGFYRPQGGAIRFAGRTVSGRKPHAIALLGIARTFQNVEVLARNSVLDNVLLGRHLYLKQGIFSSLVYVGKARRQELTNRSVAMELLDFLGLADDCDSAVGALPYGRQKLVEIARALAMTPSLLLLDEPTSGMAPTEKQAVAAAIQRVRREMKITQLIIEHDVPFVTALCDRAIVLDFGEVISDGSPTRVLSQPRVVGAYLGSAADERR